MKCFFIAFGLCISSLLVAQPHERLLSTAGASFSASQHVQMVLGEPVAGTFSRPGVVLTQGFLQVFDQTTHSFNPEESRRYVQLFPNPSDGHLTVDHSLSEAEPVSIRVFDILGQQVYSTTAYGRSQHDLSRLANGIYLLQLAQDQKTYLIKFEKH